MSDSSEKLMAHMSALATEKKAQFKGVTAENLQRMIAAQPEVQGPVAISDVVALSDGAGASNGISFFTAEYDTDDGPQHKELVARYNPGIVLLKQKSFANEFATMQAARAAGLPVARPYWLDATGDLLGTPGYIIARVDGVSPSAGVFDKGLLRDAPPEERRQIMLNAARFHGQLRKMAIPPEAVPHLRDRGVGTTAVERELNWWYREAELHDSGERQLRFIREAMKLLVERQPSTYAPNLVHGDAQYANTMFKNGEIAAVLDWELSFLGQNESDLALLTYCAETLNTVNLEGVPTTQDFILAFEEESGHPVQHWEYFQAFNLYKWVASSCLYVDAPLFDIYAEKFEQAAKSLKVA